MRYSALLQKNGEIKIQIKDVGTNKHIMPNALLIGQSLAQKDRLIQLNKVAISQMKSLTENKAFKKIK